MVKRKSETIQESKVGIYKVCVPSFIAYPNWDAILKICFTKEDAEKYIEEYPNLFIKPFLTVKYSEFIYNPTD